MKMRWIMTTGAAAMLAGGAQGAAPVQPAVPAVAAAPAATPETLTVVGLLQAEASLNLRTQVPGMVASIPHREGDSVQDGEAVVLLDDRDSKMMVDLATVDLDSAKLSLKKVQQGAREEEHRRHKALYEEVLAGLELAEKSLRSDEELHSKKMISDLELTKSERILAAARAKAESKKLDLEILQKGALPEDRKLAELDVQRRQVMLDQRLNILARARIGGTRKGTALVSRIHVQAGQWLDAGTPVAELVYMERVKMEVDLPAAQAIALATGAEAVLTSSTFPGVRLTGTVERISPIIDPASGSMRIIVLADNPDMAMRPGAEVTVEIKR